MFFPPVEPIVANKVLDVNKIHFILASEPDRQILIKQISSWMHEHSEFYQLNSFDDMWKNFAS